VKAYPLATNNYQLATDKDMFDTLDISASALQAQRVRMDSVSLNIANINTTHDLKGRPNPYKRRFVEFLAGRPGDPSQPGVQARVKQDPSYREIYDAERRQYVRHPNIDLAIEMVNGIEASRAYEANVTAMEVTKAMMNASLRLLA